MTTPDPELVRALLGMKNDDLVELAKMAKALEARAHLAGPQTDDELHEYVKQRFKVDVPRVSVCAEHQAPFDFLADMYFERENAAIAMANRGGSKTFIAAILHVLNSRFKPGVEMASVGAIEAQARRAYAHVLKILQVDGGVALAVDHPDVKSSIMLETWWKNGSKLEVLGGTKNAVNGPHPQKVHFDEVELADPEVFYESRNMAQSKDGIMAQDIITSTRKGSHGMMQKLIDETLEAEKAGMKPPYKVYAWCIFETAKNVPNCMVATPDAGGCGCDRVMKGSWDDGSPRTFDTICKGRLAQSQGWIPLDDVHKLFRENSQAVWEAQQECSRPSTEGLVIPNFNREKHGIREFDADPSNGPIYMSIDFGGTNPHAVNWYQQLRYAVDVKGYFNKGVANKTLPEGAIVCFDEIYIADVGNNAVAEMIKDRERFWKRRHPKWRVSRRFADPQAASARRDFSRDHNLPTSFFATRDVKEHIKKVKELFEDNLFFVDVMGAPMFCDEIEAWHYPKKRAALVDDPEIPVDDFNHCMSNFRYCVANIFQLKRQGGGRDRPVTGGQKHETAHLVKVIVPGLGKNPGQYIERPISGRRRERFEP